MSGKNSKKCQSQTQEQLSFHSKTTAITLNATQRRPAVVSSHRVMEYLVLTFNLRNSLLQQRMKQSQTKIIRMRRGIVKEKRRKCGPIEHKHRYSWTLYNHDQSHQNQEDQESFEILNRDKAFAFNIFVFEIRTENQADSADVIETNDKWNEDNELNERKKEVPSSAVYKVLSFKREIEDAGIDDENLARTSYLSLPRLFQKQNKESEQVFLVGGRDSFDQSSKQDHKEGIKLEQ